MNAGCVGEKQGRVQVIEDGDVDLVRAVAAAIDDEGGSSAVGLGQIAMEHFEPVVFGGGSGGGGVLE